MNWRMSGGNVGLDGRSVASTSVNRLIMPSSLKRRARWYRVLRGTPVSKARSAGDWP